MDILQRAFYPIDGNGKITVGDIVNETSGSGGEPVTVDTLPGATTTGKSLMKAANAEAARTAIGAGTSNLQLGTTASTALAGNTPIPAAATWANLTGKPATFPPTIGTTASTAKAGNYTPTIAEVTGLQAALDAKATATALANLVTRVEALEAAGG